MRDDRARARGRATSDVTATLSAAPPTDTHSTSGAVSGTWRSEMTRIRRDGGGPARRARRRHRGRTTRLSARQTPGARSRPAPGPASPTNAGVARAAQTRTRPASPCAQCRDRTPARRVDPAAVALAGAHAHRHVDDESDGVGCRVEPRTGERQDQRRQQGGLNPEQFVMRAACGPSPRPGAAAGSTGTGRRRLPAGAVARAAPATAAAARASSASAQGMREAHGVSRALRSPTRSSSPTTRHSEADELTARPGCALGTERAQSLLMGREPPL